MCQRLQNAVPPRMGSATLRHIQRVFLPSVDGGAIWGEGWGKGYHLPPPPSAAQVGRRLDLHLVLGLIVPQWQGQAQDPGRAWPTPPSLSRG